MESEIAALAASGAITLMGLMVSDAWQQVRARVGRLVSRGGDERVVTAELEATRAELVAAERTGDTAPAMELRTEWELRLRQLLRADPAAAAELRALLADTEGLRTGMPAPTSVHNTVSGGTLHGPVIQAGTVTGTVGTNTTTVAPTTPA
ncbi:hypothetical protein [Streptomyces sp. SID3343]|uniref:hypothetical protein n=1 Tax=Streptomyces sp. SID3343 TaxID=2690260 RepID=UPI001368F7F2|nr:hypothetical protein [Streptomyces sp. SID3343]MYV97343.1 hypothetical protein [Streptomyces sp. SID3343]